MTRPRTVAGSRASTRNALPIAGTRPGDRHPANAAGNSAGLSHAGTGAEAGTEAACASSNGNSNESMVSPVARNAGRSTAFEAPSIGPAPVATNVTRSCHADVIDLHLKGRTIVMKDRPMRAVLIAAPLLVLAMPAHAQRSEEHTSELQSLMRIS